MVGVAGKSKGCANCRQRRIKCDEAKPSCKRCEHSKLQCAGYDRFPVFIDRNQSGYRKRVPFEEVKPNAQLRRILSPEAEAIRLISWFRETHIRWHASQHALQTHIHWMGLVGTRHSPHPALKAALLAMSFAKWSQIECNPALKQSGRRHYQQSLELTQKALLRTEEALTDDILATTCVMTLYEMSDSSRQRVDSWLDHIAGIGNLLCLRGPEDFTSPEACAIFEHMRYIFMIRCLATRRSCVFGSIRWRQLPWCGVTKSIEQQVVDQGLRLTSLIEYCDSLSTDEHRPSDLDALLTTCIEIFETLDPLIAQISFHSARKDAGDTAKSAILVLGITASGIQLGAAASAHKLLTTADVGIFGCYVSSPTSAVETMVEAQTLCKARKQLAQTILWSVEARMKLQPGRVGTLKVLWSLQLAQEQFTPDDPEAEQCKAMLILLSECTSAFDALGLPLGKHASSPVYRSS